MLISSFSVFSHHFLWWTNEKSEDLLLCDERGRKERLFVKVAFRAKPRRKRGGIFVFYLQPGNVSSERPFKDKDVIKDRVDKPEQAVKKVLVVRSSADFAGACLRYGLGSRLA